MKLPDKSITLEDLAKFCAEFDEHGKNEYPEDAYEGRAIFSDLYWELFGKQIPPEIEYEYFKYEK